MKETFKYLVQVLVGKIYLQKIVLMQSHWIKDTKDKKNTERMEVSKEGHFGDT